MRICLFGAGSSTLSENYLEIGYTLGQKLVENGHSLVFGGGAAGMMGSVANGVHDKEGHILAIFPEWMTDFEDLYENSDNVIYTKDMNERKNRFREESDVFLITPGGIGTLDEFFEMLTLKKLKVHTKPIVIYNLDNFFDKMLDMLEAMIEDNFISEDVRDMYIVTTTLEETLEVFNK